MIINKLKIIFKFIFMLIVNIQERNTKKDKIKNLSKYIYLCRFLVLGS